MHSKAWSYWSPDKNIKAKRLHCVTLFEGIESNSLELMVYRLLIYSYAQICYFILVGTFTQQLISISSWFQVGKNASSVCSYWDWETNSWSTEGVILIKTTDDYTECESTHLTNFALLLVRCLALIIKLPYHVVVNEILVFNYCNILKLNKQAMF